MNQPQDAVKASMADIPYTVPTPANRLRVVVEIQSGERGARTAVRQANAGANRRATARLGVHPTLAVGARVVGDGTGWSLRNLPAFTPVAWGCQG
jgi:hypothetical protein